MRNFWNKLDFLNKYSITIVAIVIVILIWAFTYKSILGRFMFYEITTIKR